VSAFVHILETVPPAWGALVLDDPDATPSHRADLWYALADAVPGGTVRFVAVESDGTLMGGTGVVVERRAGFESLHALPWLLGSAPLAVPGARAQVDSACATGLAMLMRERRAIGGEWVCYRPHGAAPDAGMLAQVPGETTRLETAVVDLAGGLAAVRARIGRKMRPYLRTEPDAPVFAEEPDALDEVYALHSRQARGWDGFTPLPLELSRRLLRAGREPVNPSSGIGPGVAPLARLFTLRAEGRLLAGTLCLDHPRELFTWWSGISARARRRHLFPLLLWKTIEWSCARGRSRVNLGGSAGQASLIAFKEALGAEDRAFTVRWLAPTHARAPGRWLAAFQHWRRRGRSRGSRA
jgi:hypothetical protein